VSCHVRSICGTYKMRAGTLANIVSQAASALTCARKKTGPCRAPMSLWIVVEGPGAFADPITLRWGNSKLQPLILANDTARADRSTAYLSPLWRFLILAVSPISISRRIASGLVREFSWLEIHSSKLASRGGCSRNKTSTPLPVGGRPRLGVQTLTALLMQAVLKAAGVAIRSGVISGATVMPMLLRKGPISPQAACCSPVLISDSAGMPSPSCKRHIIFSVSGRLRASTS